MSKIFAFDTLESTNKTAKQMALAGAGHGTAIVAERQSAGRGRQGRAFFSPPGGIYLSLVLHPGELALDSPALTTIYTAVRVCQAIENKCGKSPGIKWVNDLFLDGKKICGILAETVTDGAVQWAVVGIGVNFSGAGEFPLELRGIAGSVFPDDPAVPKERLTEEIIRRLLGHSCAWEDTLREYRRRMMMRGKAVTVHAPGERYDARALDIDDSGKLLVQKLDGSVHALSSGEISIKCST